MTIKSRAKRIEIKINFCNSFTFKLMFVFTYENNFLFYSGQIKLADFGLARLYNSEER